MAKRKLTQEELTLINEQLGGIFNAEFTPTEERTLSTSESFVEGVKEPFKAQGDTDWSGALSTALQAMQGLKKPSSTAMRAPAAPGSRNTFNPSAYAALLDSQQKRMLQGISLAQPQTFK